MQKKFFYDKFFKCVFLSRNFPPTALILNSLTLISPPPLFPYNTISKQYRSHSMLINII